MSELRKMSEQEANALRCMAHEIIIKLWRAGKIDHLNLLEQHACSAATDINNQPSGAGKEK